MRLPVNRVFSRHILSPSPSVLIPIFRTPVAVITHEVHEFCIGSGVARDRKGIHFDGMRPHLIVEDEEILRSAAEQETSTRNPGVSRFDIWRWCSRLGAVAYLWSIVRRNDLRQRITQRLSGVGDRLGMHVFVKKRELIEVRFVFISAHFACRAGLSMFQYAIEDQLHVRDRFGLGWERQVPASIVWDASRIIEAITITEHRIKLAEVT